VWSLIEARHGAIPPSRVADRDLGKTIVIRLDASLVIAHSEKQWALPAAPHRRPHHPRPAQTPHPHPCHLALGTPAPRVIKASRLSN
jgi:hypothetical protein